MKTISSSRIDAARKVFERHGGTMRTSQAIKAGIHPEVLYAMRDAGGLEPLARGLYRLTESPSLGNFDLVTVSMKIPRGVICMLSALSFHELTTHIPKAVDVALVRGADADRVAVRTWSPYQRRRFSVFTDNTPEASATIARDLCARGLTPLGA